MPDAVQYHDTHVSFLVPFSHHPHLSTPPSPIRKCAICYDDKFPSFHCQRCYATACRECYTAHLQSLRGKIPTTCIVTDCHIMDKDVLQEYKDLIEESTPVSQVNWLLRDIKRCQTFAVAKPMLIELMGICFNSPCCNKAYGVAERMCMSVHCNCGVNFCGFCHKMAHEVIEPCIQSHVSLCPENLNKLGLPVRDGPNVTILPMKSPFVHDFYKMHARKRIGLFNDVIRRFVADKDYLSWVADKNAFDNIVGGMYLDKEKYELIVHVKCGKVALRRRVPPSSGATLIDLTTPRFFDGVVEIDMTGEVPLVRVNLENQAGMLQTIIEGMLNRVLRADQEHDDVEPAGKRRRTGL